MTDAELIGIATEFREGILDGKPSNFMCYAVCAPLEGLLRFYGVEVSLADNDLGECNHYWILLKDGRVLDPTADQFNDQVDAPFPPVYLGEPHAIHTGPIE